MIPRRARKIDPGSGFRIEESMLIARMKKEGDFSS